MNGLYNSLIDTYIIKKIIGVGGLSKVYLIKDIKTNQKYALKIYNERGSSLSYDKKPLVDKIRETNDSFMCYHSEKRFNNIKYSVLEHIQGVSLNMFYNILTESEALTILKRLLTQLYTLETLNLLHFDIKSRNIMVSKDKATLIDYDFLTPSSLAEKYYNRGTLYYLSPERIQRLTGSIKEINYNKSDIWSLGLSMLLVLFSLDELSKITKYSDIPNIVYPHLKHIQEIRHHVLKPLMCDMMEMEYSVRKSAKTLLLEYFNGETIYNGNCKTIIEGDKITQFNNSEIMDYAAPVV